MSISSESSTSSGTPVPELSPPAVGSEETVPVAASSDAVTPAAGGSTIEPTDTQDSSATQGSSAERETPAPAPDPAPQSASTEPEAAENGSGEGRPTDSQAADSKAVDSEAVDSEAVGSSTPDSAAVESRALDSESSESGRADSEAADATPPTDTSADVSGGTVANSDTTQAARGSSRPGAGRVPRPPRGRRPARPSAAAAPLPDEAPTDGSLWGRVDEDGTVWVRVGTSDLLVGSYPNATPEEALAFFARKYDELAGQVRLLEQRVRDTDVPVKEAHATFERLHAAMLEGHVVGDLATLGRRLEELRQAIEVRHSEQEAARAAAKTEARATKERIVADAEELAQSSSWKSAGDRLRALVEEWKAAPRIDRKADDELWKRFSAARSTFDKRRRTHFAALDGQRDEVRARKEKIVQEAESLATSKEWGPTAGRYRDLLEQWKAGGRAGKAEEEALWQRFRAAQDAFFGARNAAFSERDASLKANLSQKQELLKEAEKLLPVTDLRAAKSALRSLQDRWEAAGHVPRGDRERIEGRMRKVEQAVRDAEQSQWQRSNPEARARAESATTQLRTAIEQLEAKAAAARAAGKTKEADEAEAAAATRREWLAATEKYVR